MNNRDRVYIVDSMNGRSARKRFDNTLSTISHSLKHNNHNIFTKFEINIIQLISLCIYCLLQNSNIHIFNLITTHKTTELNILFCILHTIRKYKELDLKLT